MQGPNCHHDSHSSACVTTQATENKYVPHLAETIRQDMSVILEPSITRPVCHILAWNMAVAASGSQICEMLLVPMRCCIHASRFTLFADSGALLAETLHIRVHELEKPTTKMLKLPFSMPLVLLFRCPIGLFLYTCSG